MTVVRCNYLARKEHSPNKNSNCKPSWRNWWLVKHGAYQSGRLTLGQVTLPPHLIGKRIRFRIEVMED